jgi:hypothetical protein
MEGYLGYGDMEGYLGYGDMEGYLGYGDMEGYLGYGDIHDIGIWRSYLTLKIGSNMTLF